MVCLAVKLSFISSARNSSDLSDILEPALWSFRQLIWSCDTPQTVCQEKTDPLKFCLIPELVSEDKFGFKFRLWPHFVQPDKSSQTKVSLQNPNRKLLSVWSKNLHIKEQELLIYEELHSWQMGLCIAVYYTHAWKMCTPVIRHINVTLSFHPASFRLPLREHAWTDFITVNKSVVTVINLYWETAAESSLGPCWNRKTSLIGWEGGGGSLCHSLDFLFCYLSAHTYQILSLHYNTLRRQ